MDFTIETTHTRSSLPYNALVTRLCYKANVRTRVNDTYLVGEVPLSATSLAKSAGALGDQEAKRRRATTEGEDAAAARGSSATVAGVEEGVLSAISS